MVKVIHFMLRAGFNLMELSKYPKAHWLSAFLVVDVVHLSS